MIGEVYDVLRKFGYTYDKYNKEKNCYIKDNVRVFVIDIENDGEIGYDCSIYISENFHVNTYNNEELERELIVIDRESKIDKIND